MAEQRKPKVTYLWLARGQGLYGRIFLYGQKPKEFGMSWTGGQYICCLCEMWDAVNPEIKLKPGDCIKIKRTSLPNGFKWEVCNG